MDTTGIEKVRRLARGHRPAYLIREACREALLDRAETDSEHAELLYHYAQALAHEHNEPPAEAIKRASRAVELAVRGKDYLWATRASILVIELRFLAPASPLDTASLLKEVRELSSRMMQEWWPHMEREQKRESIRRLNLIGASIRNRDLHAVAAQH